MVPLVRGNERDGRCYLGVNVRERGRDGGAMGVDGTRGRDEKGREAVWELRYGR